MKNSVQRRPKGVALVPVLLFLLTVASSGAHAQTLQVLYSFTGAADGNGPLSDVVRTQSGILFGTTNLGGDLTCSLGVDIGCGTVFKLHNGQVHTLHKFDGTNGDNPEAGLVRDAAGNLYGTTFRGGNCTECGTVFELGQNGRSFKVLHDFTGQPADGSNPVGDLFRDKSGNLWGTTLNGGSNNTGTVFELDSTGNETFLHSFSGSDGNYPASGFVQDQAGNLYGTTGEGGDMNCDPPYGCGVVFKLDANKNLTVLYSFTGTGGSGDGSSPSGNLVLLNGNLYGTTTNGGDPTCNCGTVFELFPSGNGWAEAVLHAFTGGNNDGNTPEGGLVARLDFLYGTTLLGGPANKGTIFRVAGGTVNVLYNFCSMRGCTDGNDPFAGVVVDAHGKVYGTTYQGGANNYGVVFEFTP
jgi:uncharacterized repeat protein (TIGR03803 family)